MIATNWLVSTSYQLTAIQCYSMVVSKFTGKLKVGTWNSHISSGFTSLPSKDSGMVEKCEFIGGQTGFHGNSSWFNGNFRIQLMEVR